MLVELAIGDAYGAGFEYDGIHAAQASALMAHYFFQRTGPKFYLGKFLESHIPGNWNIPYTEFIGPKGWMSVRAAVTLSSI